MYIGLVLVDGNIGPGLGLDDVFTFDLEVNMIGGEWTHGLLYVCGCINRSE